MRRRGRFTSSRLWPGERGQEGEFRIAIDARWQGRRGIPMTRIIVMIFASAALMLAADQTFTGTITDQMIRSLQEYEVLWATWEAEGFHVLGCTSLGGSVQMLNVDVGIFTHAVRTTLADGDGTVKTGERETIVFQRIDGIWLGVHEHLSIDPTF